MKNLIGATKIIGCACPEKNMRRFTKKDEAGLSPGSLRTDRSHWMGLEAARLPKPTVEAPARSPAPRCPPLRGRLGRSHRMLPQPLNAPAKSTWCVYSNCPFIQMSLIHHLHPRRGRDSELTRSLRSEKSVAPPRWQRQTSPP